MHLAPGQTVSRYVIETLLGEGGMGKVYRARDTRLERHVALKVLRKESDEGASEAWEQAVMRMQREAQAVAALSHPGIVAIYDIGEHDGAPFIAMELVAGKPLREFVGTDLAISVRRRILLDVARALAAAHEAGFMHRDIKPENILVRPDNSAKVLDFGIARRTSHVEAATNVDVQGATIDSALVQMTADGVLLGTPAYMAPEQLRGETLDARADQFAWGVVAYEFLTGKHPFHAEKGPMVLMASILSETPAPMENVSDDVAQIVMRALAKDPAERWESMQEIVAALESFMTLDEPRASLPRVSKPVVVSESQTAPVAPEKPQKSKARFLIPAFAAMMTVAVLVSLSRRTGVESATTAVVPSASVMPSAVPTAITDLPLPHSTSAEARAAYREGVQSVRDARWGAATDAFMRARKADPEMAIAHLRFAMIDFLTDAPQAREAFRTALGLRGTLSEREAALLHAFEPMVQRDPSDFATASQRFEALVNRYPLDAELLYWHGDSLNRSRVAREVQERVIQIADRCVAVDPHYADCWQMKAGALSLLDRTEEAVVALDSCIAQCPNSVDCLQGKITLDGKRGRCAETAKAARQLAAMDPQDPLSQRMHTEVLYYADAPESVVRATGEETIRLFQKDNLEFDANDNKKFLAIGFGDFETARKISTANMVLSAAPSLARAGDHLLVHLEILIEMNQWEQAASVAANALQSRPSGPPFANARLDPTLTLNAVLLRTGKISRKQYEATRAQWLAAHEAPTSLEQQFRWLAAYGIPTYTKDLAADAVAEAERIGPPKDLYKSPLGVIWAVCHGKALMTLGKPHEALPFLERATHSCSQTTLMLWFVQSRALLGMAHEVLGNETLACESYAKVLNRWATSKQSVTAKTVTEHAQKLHCSPTSK